MEREATLSKLSRVITTQLAIPKLAFTHQTYSTSPKHTLPDGQQSPRGPGCRPHRASHNRQKAQSRPPDTPALLVPFPAKPQPIAEHLRSSDVSHFSRSLYIAPFGADRTLSSGRSYVGRPVAFCYEWGVFARQPPPPTGVMAAVRLADGGPATWPQIGQPNAVRPSHPASIAFSLGHGTSRTRRGGQDTALVWIRDGGMSPTRRSLAATATPTKAATFRHPSTDTWAYEVRTHVLLRVCGRSAMWKSATAR